MAIFPLASDQTLAQIWSRVNHVKQKIKMNNNNRMTVEKNNIFFGQTINTEAFPFLTALTNFSISATNI